VESELEAEPELSVSKRLTLLEHLDDMCIYYMSIGVPNEVFWDGDYTQLKYFYQAHLKRKEDKNHELWLQGAYINNALESSIGNLAAGLGGKRGKNKYLAKPIRITPLSDIEKENEILEQRRKFVASIDALAMQQGKKTLKELQQED